MFSQFISIGLLILFSAMLPGPDFAMVTKNTILYSRRAGIFTSIGISIGLLIHIAYCLLGLAIIISQSIIIFNVIKLVGAVYLIYLGLSSLFSKKNINEIDASKISGRKKSMPDHVALRQGFLCNVLNPKATLFFLALFTLVIKPGTPLILEAAYAVEILIISIAWFCSLTVIISHPRVLATLTVIEDYISKVLGIFLIGFGVALAFVRN